MSSPSAKMWYLSRSLWCSSSVLSLIYRGGLQLNNIQRPEFSRVLDNTQYLVVKGSVYWMPFASSMSDTSLRRLRIASNISLSASSAFSPSVFFASTAVSWIISTMNPGETDLQLPCAAALPGLQSIVSSPFLSSHADAPPLSGYLPVRRAPLGGVLFFDAGHLHQVKSIWQASPCASGRWVCMARSRRFHLACKLERANVHCGDACPLWFTQEAVAFERADRAAFRMYKNLKSIRGDLRWNSTQQHILTVVVSVAQIFAVFLSDLS